MKERQKGVVYITSKIYEKLLRAYTRYGRIRPRYPYVYLMARNENGVISDIVKINLQSNSGCPEFPSIDSRMIHKSYLKLAKKGLIPCGFARVSFRFRNGGRWHGDCGNAMWGEQEFILTIGENYWTIQKPSGYGETKLLEVGITDK